MLQRMKSIAPGPFNIQVSGDKVSQIPRHRENPSTGRSQGFIRPTSSGNIKSHASRPASSSPIYTRARTQSTSTVSGLSRYVRDTPEVPAVPSFMSTGEFRLHDDKPSSIATPKDLSDFDPLGHVDRPQLFSQEERSHLPSQLQEPSQSRLPEPSLHSHKPRPSVIAAMQPLHEIGSASSFKPFRSIKGRAASQGATKLLSKPGESISSRDDTRLLDAPPVPAPFRRAYSDEPGSSHRPHESTSSNGSYTSGAGSGSGSSRSSPPLHESPRRLGQEFSDITGSDNMFNGFKFGVEDESHFEELRKYQYPSFQKSERYAPQFATEPPPASARLTIPNAEPRAPPARQISSPLTSPEEYVVSSPDRQSNNLHLSPALVLSPPATAFQRRSPTRAGSSDKGPCRGCGELIKGKSVSSADGRLTGRYHKSCFVCKMCNSPFQTADFYVISNLPYCARHYHELNNSLCQGCDRGIEGQYLETESRHKFHSYCFTCQDCHRILRDDYYEWNGRTLCEQHAFRAVQQPSSNLGMGGRRFPERRTTKLMMMM